MGIKDKKDLSKNLERSSTYRKIYFKHNPGIFHKWYLCAYCVSIFLDRDVDIIEVDHNIAVYVVQNLWYYRWIFKLFGWNVNSHYNLVAACRKCNRKKSKKAGKWVIMGATGGVYHRILQLLSNALLISLVKYWYIYLLVIAFPIIYLLLLLNGII